MFVRVIHDQSRVRPRWRVLIVESYRLGNAVRQRVIKEIGTAYDSGHREQLRAEGKLYLLTLREQELNGTPPLLSSPTLKAIQAQARRQQEQASVPSAAGTVDAVQIAELYLTGETITAGNLVWSQLYSEIGWDQVLGPRRVAGNRILKEVVLANLERPRSKRRIAAEHRPMQGSAFTEDRIYQTMDYLDEERIQAMQSRWRTRVQTLLPQPITAVFYDTTTLAFESAREDLGCLRKKGYSKDGRPHDVQVLFGLIMTHEGLPLGFRVYPGNRYEGHTLLTALQSLQLEGFTDDITVVADAGLCNHDNQALLRQHGYSYILGRGVRKLPNRYHAQLLDRSQFAIRTLPNEQPVELLVLTEGKHKVVVTYSEPRAKHDAQQREKKLEKLRQQVGDRAPSKTVMPNDKSKFLSLTHAGYVELDEAAIAADAQWDGLHAIVTNAENPLPETELLAQYQQLWQIEDCFRTTKHDLQIRPIYHYTDPRIHAHLAICYMGFCCLQELRYRLRNRGLHLSVSHLISQLNSTHLSYIETTHNKQQYIITQPLRQDLQTILRAADVHWPKYSFAVPGNLRR